MSVENTIPGAASVRPVFDKAGAGLPGSPVITERSFRECVLEKLVTLASGKANKVSGSVAGNIAALDANGDLVDGGVSTDYLASLDTPEFAHLPEVVAKKADAASVYTKNETDVRIDAAADNRIPYANSGKTSLVVGTGNDNHDKGSVAVFGASNNVQSGYTLVGGYGNSLDDGSNGSIVGGYNNEVHGKRNIVGGGSNTTGSTEGKNTVTGSDMIVSGRDNNASGSFSIVSGQGNSVTGDRELFIGQGLKGQYNNGALLGQYNYPLNGVRFSIGCGGSDSTRQNALVLTDDGALYLKGVGGYNGTTFVGASSLAIALNYIWNYLVRDEITGALALGYNSSTKELQLTYEGDRVSSIDAKAFIKDGMVSNVAIENGSIVITFNTDAGKEPISIPLTDIFDPNNYVAKTVATTWSALRTLKNNSSLVPGQKYRITDYATTTRRSGTQSANHSFDVIVTAVSTNELAAEASAAPRSGDTYFANADLGKWRLWYSLENDTNRFDWATSDGKGVVYRMIDEFGNDCPYDFKNIQFAKPLDNTTVYCYTFDGGWSQQGARRAVDFSLDGSGNFIFGNKMAPYSVEVTSSYYMQQKLNAIVFLGYNVEQNTFAEDCRDMLFGQKTVSSANVKWNKFGNACHDNNFGSLFVWNTVGANVTECTYTYTSSTPQTDVSSPIYWCHSNTIGDSCNNVTLTRSCRGNSFGALNTGINLATGCASNEFGASCAYLDIGQQSVHNAFAPGYAGADGAPVVIPANTENRSFVKTQGADGPLAKVAVTGSYNDLSDKPVIDVSLLATKTELGTHTGNTNIHITANERAAWNAKADAVLMDDRFSMLNGEIENINTTINETKGLIVKQPEIQFDTTDVFVFSREDSIIVTDRFDTLTMPETLVYDGTGADHAGDPRYEYSYGVYWKGESENCTVLLFFVPTDQQFQVTVLDSDSSHGGRIGYTTYTIDDAHSSETESLSLTCGPDSLVFRRSQPAVNEIEALHNETEALRSALRYDMVDAEVSWRGFRVPDEWFPIVVNNVRTYTDSSRTTIDTTVGSVIINLLDQNDDVVDMLSADSEGHVGDQGDLVTFNGVDVAEGNFRLDITTDPNDSGFYTCQLQDRAVNTVSAQVPFTGLGIPPPAVDGKVRDFAIRAVMEPGASVEDLAFEGMTLVNAAGEMPEIAPGYSTNPDDPDYGTDPVETILYFTEISPDTFLVKGETVKVVGS